MSDSSLENPTLEQIVKSVLSPDLSSDDYLLVEYVGNRLHSNLCYVASEAYYHLAGGKKAGLKPMQANFDGLSHWWLQDEGGNVIDLTEAQFGGDLPDYSKGTGRGFLTKKPSKRAQEIIRRAERWI